MGGAVGQYFCQILGTGVRGTKRQEVRHCHCSPEQQGMNSSLLLQVLSSILAQQPALSPTFALSPAWLGSTYPRLCLVSLHVHFCLYLGVSASWDGFRKVSLGQESGESSVRAGQGRAAELGWKLTEMSWGWPGGSGTGL